MRNAANDKKWSDQKKRQKGEEEVEEAEGEGQDSSLSSGFGLEGFTATAIKVREIGIKI